ncbi:PLP-dependent decarboxylase [Robbsia andropogonis]|uniref:PLP-dependent decarboxylase n=1 Tax=Robbsia andropogonis TaxID=28092 RepID=UPI002A6B434F|nr:PLP-dependent decarboxylase [Robbsia andropogonis]
MHSETQKGAEIAGQDDAWLADLKTPCYVYEPEIAIARYRALKAQLGTRLIVSLKANPNEDMLMRCGHAYEDGVELASRGELDIVVGRIKAPRYLNNPSMNEDFIRAGLASRCNFVLDSLDHVARFIPLAREAVAGGATLGKLLLRLNAGDLAGARSRSNWHDHFGMTSNEALASLQTLVAAGMRVNGLHVFSGPHSFLRGDGTEPETLALPAALESLARDLTSTNGAPFEALSLGGGFPEQPVQLEAFERYRAAVEPLAARYSLAHESGRAIFADAGIFVTRIMAVKHWANRTIAVCDGGISHNFLLAQTESVIRHLKTPRLVRRSTAAAAAAQSTVFVGSTCSRADVIGHSKDVAAPQPGDLAVFSQCGAYNRTYTMSDFLSHRAAHVYIKPA